ncbi:unnamed protein product [Angiostrongylus costaricensis]|uniref:F-box domain-containing protein n=1 Tax=Angiostrongylus costaricensis TaxID=334426 RepID=A0A158PK75_ANGCS|nr:unnamed protein product [Angiostrongylus costaricensis]
MDKKSSRSMEERKGTAKDIVIKKRLISSGFDGYLYPLRPANYVLICMGVDNVFILVDRRGTSSRRGKRLAAQSKTHPTIQAKQNQMYLITTLAPAPSEQALINKALPKELLLRIFSYLDMKTLCRCAQACRLWNVLALDGSNWQRVDLFTFQKDVKAATVENLARRCGGFLKKLSLKGCENIQDSALRSFTAKCANIEHLSLYKCKRVTDATCENLGRHCHKLVHLNLENCTAITDRALRHIRSDKPTIANDETVAHIAHGSPHLQYLCLSNCTQITDRSLISLSQGCKMLTDVELSGCSLLTDAGFIQLARHCKGLARMDLEDCSLITDATIHSLSTNCNGLSELSLSHCELITDESIHCLCTNNKDKLQVLELDNCPQITDSALSHMRHAKALKRIDLYDCQNISKEAIQRFKHHRPHVEIHAYFAPATPPTNQSTTRAGLCRCCAIL